LCVAYAEDCQVAPTKYLHMCACLYECVCVRVCVCACVCLLSQRQGFKRVAVVGIIVAHAFYTHALQIPTCVCRCGYLFIPYADDI